jgi:hypothetical protein
MAPLGGPLPLQTPGPVIVPSGEIYRIASALLVSFPGTVRYVGHQESWLMKGYIGSFLAAFFLPACLFAAQTPELRGVWVHGPQIKTPAAADALVARIEHANLNAAFVLVWYWGGQAYFQSSLCAMAEGVQGGYDPLGYMVGQCHQRGIQVHAWFVNGAYGAPEVRHILDQHPDWAVQDGAGGIWYDFSRPEVRRFESDLMIECLRKYDIDGLHFDYIRYGPHHAIAAIVRRRSPAAMASRRSLPPHRLSRRCHDHGNPLAKPTTRWSSPTFTTARPRWPSTNSAKGAAAELARGERDAARRG